MRNGTWKPEFDEQCEIANGLAGDLLDTINMLLAKSAGPTLDYKLEEAYDTIECASDYLVAGDAEGARDLLNDWAPEFTAWAFAYVASGKSDESWTECLGKITHDTYTLLGHARTAIEIYHL